MADAISTAETPFFQPRAEHDGPQTAHRAAMVLTQQEIAGIAAKHGVTDRLLQHHVFRACLISESGRVFSVRKRPNVETKSIELAQAVAEWGHHRVCIKVEGKSRWQQVHRLVADMYLPSPATGPICRHLDGNPHNNHWSNLAWGTQQSNVQDSITHGTFAYGDKMPHSKLNEAKVIEIRTSTESSAVIGERLGVPARLVRQVRLGQLWAHVAVSMPSQVERGCCGTTKRGGALRPCTQLAIVWVNGNGFCYYHNPEDRKKGGEGRYKAAGATARKGMTV